MARKKKPANMKTIAENWSIQLERNPYLQNKSPEELEFMRRLFFAGASSVVGRPE